MALKMLRTLILSTVAAAAACLAVAGSAHAAPSRAELEQQLIDMEDEIARMRSQISGLQGPVQQRLDSIQSELVRVVGELEEARFMNTRLQNELRALRRELQLRDAEIAEELGLEPAFTSTDDPFATPTATLGPGLRQEGAEGAPGASPGPSNGGGVLTLPEGVDPISARGGSANPPSTPSFFDSQPYQPVDPNAPAPEVDDEGYLLPADSAAALNAAKEYVLASQFDVAERAFDEFLERFSDSPQAAEALFWQGELRFANEDFSGARDSYVASLRADVSGPRAADAMIQVAKAAHYMGAPDQACSTLASFPEYFPNASAALRSKAESARQLASCR